MRNGLVLVVVIAALCSWAVAEDKAPSVVGWRGDGTGRYPDASPPVTWSRIPKSPVHDLRFQAAKPEGSDTGEKAKPVVDGFVTDWLVIGPYPAKATGTASMVDEAKVMPAAGDKTGDLEWKLHEYPQTRKPWEGCQSDWVDFKKTFDFGEDQAAYAHAYLYAQTGGKATLIVNHGEGAKVWFNGELKYDAQKVAFTPDYNLTWFFTEMAAASTAPRFDVEFKKGWNRILFKVNSGKKDWKFTIKVTVVADTEYESKNIAWVTKLPAKSLSTPVIVGDKIFVTSEPDEVICLDRFAGKILWRRATTYWHAVPEQERTANPLFKEMEPILPQLEATSSFWDERLPLQRKLQDLLWKVDKKRFPWSKFYHLNSVGFTTPTPVTDGEFIYLYFGHGVVTCFDFDGNRKWAQLVTDMPGAGENEGNNVVSPTIVDDKLIIFRGWARAFDKKTGKVVWDTGVISPEPATEGDGKGKVDFHSNQSIVVGTVGDTKVAFCFKGRAIRVSDGKVLQRKMLQQRNVAATPIVVGDRIFHTDGYIEKFKLDLKGDELQLVSEGKARVTDGKMASSLFTVGRVAQ